MTKVRIKRVGKPGVSPISDKSTQSQQTGFGYVLIPEGVDRDKFVHTCFRTNKISIVDDSDGNVVHDCYISSEALQNIRFPRLPGEKGQPVMYVSQSYNNQPLIIGTFQPTEDVTLRGDEEINFYREWDKGSLSITGSAREGTLYINVHGDQSGVMKISSTGSDSSLLDIYSAGSVNVSANRNVKVTSYEQLDARVVDPLLKNISGVSMNKGEVTIKATYGEEKDIDQRDFYKSRITEEGVKTEIRLGDTEFVNTVTEEQSETTIFDCLVRLEDGKATVSQGEAVVELGGGKMSIINDSTGVKAMLEKLVEIVNTLTVTTAMGPSGTPLPPTIQKTTELTNMINKFFNN